MRLKISKEQLLQELHTKLTVEGMNLMSHSYVQNPGSVMNDLQYYIKANIMLAVETLLVNSYTDEDFNRDLEDTLSK